MRFVPYGRGLRTVNINMLGASTPPLDPETAPGSSWVPHLLQSQPELVEVHFQWRPQTPDPNDEMVLETADQRQGGPSRDIQRRRLCCRREAFQDFGAEAGRSAEEGEIMSKARSAKP